MTKSLPPENLKPTRARHLNRGPLGVARVLVNLFSGGTPGQRDPPFPKKTQHIRLITVAVSHYCEKVRWGLDLLEADENDSPIYYTEDAHAPGFSSFFTVPASNDTASQVPMIVMEEDDAKAGKSRMMYGSDVILKKLCPFLYPEDIAEEIHDMEAFLGQRLGPSVRCLVYHHLLQPKNHKICARICAENTSNIEKVLFEKMLSRGLSQRFRKFSKINEDTAEASEAAVRDIFADVSKRLEQNNGGRKKYLLGNTFTAADLTFAALASPMFRLPQLKTFVPVEDSELPLALLKLADEMRATTAGQHVVNMYEQHRGTDRVVIKSVGRDRFAWEKIVVPIGVVAVAAIAIALALSL